MRKMIGIYCKDSDFAIKIFSVLLDNKNDDVISWAAVDALRFNVLIDKALPALEKISLRTDIIGGNAKMALRIYRGEIEGKTLM
jgi:hypothetical protein